MTSGVTMATIGFCFLPPLHSKNRHLTRCSARPFSQVRLSAPSYRGVTKPNTRSQDWSAFPSCYMCPLCFMGIYMYLAINLIPCLFFFFASWLENKTTPLLLAVRVQNQQSHPKVKTLIFMNKRMLSSLM